MTSSERIERDAMSAMSSPHLLPLMVLELRRSHHTMNVGMSTDKGAGEHVFISYVREDAKRVDRLQRMLETDGITVWRDVSNLWPGQDWKIEIRRAIERGVAFIACFSEHTGRRDISYQNEELAVAVDLMRRRQPGQVWLLPVRFADCQLPQFDLGGGRTLDSIQRIDLFDGAAWDLTVTRLVTESRSTPAV